MNETLIALPSRIGWTVGWYTGEVRIIRYKNKNRKPKEVRVKNSYESTSKEMVLSKKQELEKNGFEIAYFSECVF